MPGQDGWTVLAALKADPTLADIPVIMLSILDEKTLGFTLGATHYLTKPVDRARLVAAVEDCAARAPGVGVLIVEDDAATRDMLRRTLERAGWPVAVAENGRVALARLAAQRPRLVLLDLMMPEMDGFEFLEAVGRQPNLKGLPIIVLTAKELSAEDVKRLNGGVERIVHKNASDGAALLAEIRELVAARVGARQDGSAR
jgi:CheY-like chemotaxis protein